MFTSAQAVALLEYTPAGALVNTMTTQFQSTNLLTDSGTATTGGHIGISGGRIAVAGYNTALATASVTTTTAKGLNMIGPDRSVVGRHAFTLSGAIRSATPASSTSDNSFYFGGANYTDYSDGTNVVTLATTNTRSVDVFNGQLYNQASAIFATVGSGTPTTATQTVTTQITSAGTNAQSMVAIDANAGVVGLDRVYLADAGTGANGGLQRWDYNGTAWSLTYNVRPTAGAAATAVGTGTTSMTGLYGLTVSWDSTTSTATIYATTSETTTAQRLVKMTDSGGAPSSLVILANTATNYIFRGVKLYTYQ